MRLIRLNLSTLCIVGSLTACFPIGADSVRTAAEPSAATLDNIERASELSTFTLPNPVSFVRRDSNACPDTEGGAKWYAQLDGMDAVRVTYGIRFNGEFDGRLHTLSLNPRHSRQYEMMCTGDGEALDWEPFVVEIEVIW